MACETDGVGGYVRAKLGRCSRCMRSSFALAAVGVAATLVLRGTPGAAARLAALPFVVLWLTHVVVFAARQASEYVELKRLRRKPAAVPAVFHRLVRGLSEGVVRSLPLLLVRLLGIAQAKPDCNCYFDDDCWIFRICDYNTPCTRIRKGQKDCPQSDRSVNGSCDGVCTWGIRKGVAFSGPELAPWVDRYFDLFIAAARTGPGLPDTDALAAIDRSVADDCRSDLKRWVLGTLEIVLGWDLVMGEYDPGDADAPPRDAFLAHVADAEGTPGILIATREALGAALRAEDPDRVVGPLEAFWERHPTYRPAHTGRCYPHGHERWDSALECQIAQLRWRVRALLYERLERRAA